MRYYINYISILTFCIILTFVFTNCGLLNKDVNKDERNKKEEEIYSLNMPTELGNKWEYSVKVKFKDQEESNFIENHEIIDINKNDSSKIFWTVLEKIQDKETTVKKYYGTNWNQTEFYLNRIVKEGIDIFFEPKNNNQKSYKNNIIKELYSPGILIVKIDKEDQQNINSKLKEDITTNSTKYYNVLGSSNIYKAQTIEINSKKFENCLKSVVSYRKIDEKTNKSLNISEIYWICPKVGIVKYIYTSGDGENTIIKELNNYEVK